MSLRTRITELLEIEHPVVQGGMQHVGRAELASAVSNAGGLGILTALTQPDPDALSREIERCRRLTEKPFGINLTVFPTINPPDYAGYVRAILDSGVTIVETAGNQSVRAIWDLLKSGGVTIIHKCTSVRHALSAEKAGCDILSIDGFECAGHPGEDDVSGLVLIPAAADAISAPILASGGFADGRGLAAALALGAEGINMGTRFCATAEAPIHPNIKRAILANDERGSLLIFRSLKNTARVGRSAVSEEVARRLGRPDATFDDVKELVAGSAGREVLETGDLSRGLFWAGMAQGLIHDLPTCNDLVRRIVGEAESIIADRLGKMSAPVLAGRAA